LHADLFLGAVGLQQDVILAAAFIDVEVRALHLDGHFGAFECSTDDRTFITVAGKNESAVPG
jgi:hypothetical protein